MYHGWIKFAFIRHPVSRFMSCYKEKVLKHYPFQSKYTQCNIQNYFPKMEINEFIKYVKAFNLDSPYTDEHIRTQISMIDMENIDFIGTLEHFKSDIAMIISSKNIPHINKTDVKIKLTEKQISEIVSLYTKDYKLYHNIIKDKY